MKNRTIGSVFIVAGTTIGAGMLAMPLAAVGIGFRYHGVIAGGLMAINELHRAFISGSLSIQRSPIQALALLRNVIWVLRTSRLQV